jgi:hypothetical protein
MKKLVILSLATLLFCVALAQNSESDDRLQLTNDQMSAFEALHQFDMALCLIKLHAGLSDPFGINRTMHFEYGYKTADFDLLTVGSLLYWADHAKKVEIVDQSDKHMIFRAHGVLDVPFLARSQDKTTTHEYLQIIKPLHQQIADDLGCVLSMKVAEQGIEVSITKK